MDDFDDLYPELTLETDDMIMTIAVKKDYSRIEDLDKRKEEFINDLNNFIKEFSETPEVFGIKFFNYFFNIYLCFKTSCFFK